MKKKIIIAVLTLAVLMVSAGCTAKLPKINPFQNVSPAEQPGKTAEVLPQNPFSDSVTFEDFTFPAPFDREIGGYENTSFLSFNLNGEHITVTLVYYEDTTFADQQKNIQEFVTGETTINGITYTTADVRHDSGTVTHAYITEYNNRLYFINYESASSEDREDLRNEFMQNVTVK